MLLIVDSFIQENERLDLLCAAYSASDGDWFKENGYESNWVGNRLLLESPVFESLNKKIRSYFNDIDSTSPFKSIQRFRVGTGMGEHTDNYHETCNFGCTVYINDNFDGGELVYPRLNKSFKPLAGRLIIHAGDEPHLVNTVSGRDRYMLTSFIYGTKEKQSTLRDIHQ
jgi:hypothetical protein